MSLSMILSAQAGTAVENAVVSYRAQEAALAVRRRVVAPLGAAMMLSVAGIAEGVITGSYDFTASAAGAGVGLVVSAVGAVNSHARHTANRVIMDLDEGRRTGERVSNTIQRLYIPSNGQPFSR